MGLDIVFFADIQEFYEITLLDDSKTTHQKTLETLQIASKWEHEPPVTNNVPKYDVSAMTTLEHSTCDLPHCSSFHSTLHGTVLNDCVFSHLDSSVVDLGTSLQGFIFVHM